MRQLYRNILGTTTGLAIWIGIAAMENQISEQYRLSEPYSSVVDVETAMVGMLAAAYTMEKISPRVRRNLS